VLKLYFQDMASGHITPSMSSWLHQLYDPGHMTRGCLPPPVKQLSILPHLKQRD
jgi:hypothetical protein